MSLRISILRREEDSVIVCSLSGSLDTETHQEFTAKLGGYLNQTTAGIILSLKDLDYISSLGISALLQLHHDTAARKISLSVVEVPAHIQQVFKIVNALPNMRVFANMEEADRYFMEIQNKIKEGR